MPHLLLEPKVPHMLASAAIMAVPGLMAWGSDALMRLAFTQQRLAEAAAAAAAAGGDGGKLALAGAAAAGRPASRAAAAAAGGADTIVPFLSLSYGYLPLVWGVTLSHYLPAFLEEAGSILPVTAATFGLDGAGLPSLVADHAVTQFLQVGGGGAQLPDEREGRVVAGTKIEFLVLAGGGAACAGPLRQPLLTHKRKRCKTCSKLLVFYSLLSSPPACLAAAGHGAAGQCWAEPAADAQDRGAALAGAHPAMLHHPGLHRGAVVPAGEVGAEAGQAARAARGVPVCSGTAAGCCCGERG